MIRRISSRSSIELWKILMRQSYAKLRRASPFATMSVFVFCRIFTVSLSIRMKKMIQVISQNSSLIVNHMPKQFWGHFLSSSVKIGTFHSPSIKNRNQSNKERLKRIYWKPRFLNWKKIYNCLWRKKEMILRIQ